jgi:hypothetical protein
MANPCNCASLPDFFRRDTSKPLGSSLKLVQEHDWLQLFRCQTCGQYWQLDVPDKLQVNLAIKIAEPRFWDTFDDKTVRLAFLTQSRGGLSGERCKWQECGAASLRGLAFCPTHAYERMGLRE